MQSDNVPPPLLPISSASPFHVLSLSSSPIFFTISFFSLSSIPVFPPLSPFPILFLPFFYLFIFLSLFLSLSLPISSLFLFFLFLFFIPLNFPPFPSLSLFPLFLFHVYSPRFSIKKKKSLQNQNIPKSPFPALLSVPFSFSPRSSLFASLSSPFQHHRNIQVPRHNEFKVNLLT